MPREVARGTRWNDNTSETNLLGILHFGQPRDQETLATYLTEKVWVRGGMEQVT